MAKDTQRLWAKCVFVFRQDLPMWLQRNWSWVPHELCCPQFPPHLPPPSSTNAGKQLGLWMVWVFSSSLCFCLLVFLSICRVAMVLSLWVDAGWVFYLGYVAPWASASPMSDWTVLGSIGSWVFKCSLWFCLPVREGKCSLWVWPRTEGAIFSMTTGNRH